MNIKIIALVVIMLSFLAGAFISVLDPVRINWNWFVPVILAGVAGLYLFRKAQHGEARASHRLSGNLQILDTSLANILEQLESLNSSTRPLPVYQARFEIDRLLREDLNNFAMARETMMHVFGMQHYADVMSAFAAGERYINRVWSASTDGYVDEVSHYLDRALQQFREAHALYADLQKRNEAVLSPS